MAHTDDQLMTFRMKNEIDRSDINDPSNSTASTKKRANSQK